MSMTAESIPSTALLEVSGDWEHSVRRLWKESGWKVVKRGNKLLGWRPDELKPLPGGLRFVESVTAAPIWLGGRHQNSSIRLSSRRLYFSDKDCTEPLRKSELELFSSNARPRFDKQGILLQLKRATEVLGEARGISSVPADREQSSRNLLLDTKAIGRNGAQIRLAQDMWSGISRAGVSKVPDSLLLYVVNDSTQPDGARRVEEYTRFLQQKWSDATGAPAALTVKQINLESLLHELETSSHARRLDHTVFLLAVTGARGQPLPHQQSRVMSRLDALGQPYRLFSYDNRNLRFSASNQVLSLLQAVGGEPYRLDLPFPEPFEKSAIFGLDLGHDHDRRWSDVVVSVLDSGGAHIVSVKQRLGLNEALEGSRVARLLQAARDSAEEQLGWSIQRCLVLRDGRVPARKEHSRGESVADYVEALGVPTTLVEVRKRGNPPLWIESGPQVRPAPAGSVFSPRDAEVRFITCYDSIQQAGPPRTFKIAVPAGGDTFGWGLDAYASIVCGLCYSPSLGVKPHLPGPIYWADGIAKTSASDNRFRGQNVRDID